MPTLTEKGAATKSGQVQILSKRVGRLNARVDRINMRLKRPGETKRTLKLLTDELVMREAELTFKALQLKALASG